MERRRRLTEKSRRFHKVETSYLRKFFRSLLKDKDGRYSLREVVVALFVIVTLVSWGAHLFYDAVIPEYMFYAFITIILVGCFGYSIERSGIGETIRRFRDRFDS